MAERGSLRNAVLRRIRELRAEELIRDVRVTPDSSQGRTSAYVILSYIPGTFVYFPQPQSTLSNSETDRSISLVLSYQHQILQFSGALLCTLPHLLLGIRGRCLQYTPKQIHTATPHSLHFVPPCQYAFCHSCYCWSLLSRERRPLQSTAAAQPDPALY